MGQTLPDRRRTPWRFKSSHRHSLLGLPGIGFPSMAEAMDDLRRGRDAYAQSRVARCLRGPRGGGAAGADPRRRSCAAGDVRAPDRQVATRARRPSSAPIDAFLEGEAPLSAARVAVLLGMNLAIGGRDRVRRRLVRSRAADRRGEGGDCVERGYLLLPLMFRHEAAGEYERRLRGAMESVSIAERFHDADLLAMTLHVAGWRASSRAGSRTDSRLLDEAMVSVAAERWGRSSRGSSTAG